MHYKTALIIGRFQPFHPGHMYLIKKALSVADNVIIGIGSTNLKNADNPFSYEERLTMLQTWIDKERVGDRVKKIVGIEDTPDDSDWILLAMKKTGPVDVVFGNNDWVNDLYKAKGIPVIEVKMFKRHIYEGKKIRATMRKNGEL